MSDYEKNLEAALTERIQGYDRLGRLMGELPEMAIFRRFGALSAEDILYRQAELVLLEETLRKQQRNDKESQHPDRERYARDWFTLQCSGDEDAPEGNDGSQLETILEIRGKLKDYHEALLRHRKVVELEWMTDPSRGNVFLAGLDRHIWDEPDIDDMVTLEPPSPESKFTTDLTIGLVQAYNKVLGRHIHKPGAKDHLRKTIRYSDKGIFRVLKTLCTIIACLLPVGGIAVLYVIDNMPARIGAVAGFTALFSITLSLLTSAPIHNVFAATSAFAAVLVVFVGTADLGRQPTNT
ncbi:hypothetical protein QBC47DRAFT_397123 [Echria macrotheca]|uniref:DUF6594 domain-containing protein n=1 Tax=Echria macrotheca TaxID=438768 RepID=A0AAJ0BQ92_9PEZI|nr:hypothetical protein QBC47DRAFT_397123 [Echria macrotheca]